MNVLQRLIHKPRTFTARQWLFQIHLWSGLITALYVLVVSVSGGILVYREELESILQPHLYRAEVAGSPVATPQLIEASLLPRYPNYRMSFISYPGRTRQTIHVYLASKARGGGSIQMFVHPVTGEFLGERTQRGTFMAWLQDLHYNLLAGRTGRLVNGIGALALTLLVVSGVVVWWPGVKRWVRAVRIDWARGWKRVNYDIHSAVGFWALAIMGMWALTGVFFTWPTEFRNALAHVLPMQRSASPKSVPGQGHAQLQEILNHVANADPAGRIASIAYPLTPTATYRIGMEPMATWHPRGDTHVFDQYSGALLGVLRRDAPAAIGDTVMDWLGTAHFGDFGPWPVKVAWFILGIAPALLAASGALMWWNRVGVKWWRRRYPTRGTRRGERVHQLDDLVSTTGSSRRQS